MKRFLGNKKKFSKIMNGKTNKSICIKSVVLSLMLVSFTQNGCGLIVTKEDPADTQVLVETITNETVDAVETTETTEGPKEVAPADQAVSMEIPNEQNGFWVEQKIGQNASIDLDGDGNEDVIHLELSQYTDCGNNYDYIKSLKVNDKEYASVQNEDYMNSLSSCNVMFETPYTEAYYVVDLDATDKYKEIALCDWGVSDSLVTNFLRYDQGNMTYLGYVPGFPTSTNYKMDGQGQLQAEGNLLIFQTWSCVYNWKLGADGRMEQVKQDMYQASQGSLDYNKEFPCHQIVDLTIYSSPDTASATIQATASPDATVTFTETDNEHWVHMVRSDGIGGWLYIDNYCSIISGTDQFYSMDAFDNLLMVS